MNISFSGSYNSSYSFNRFGFYFVSESNESGNVVDDKIINGFISLLKSISHSFSYLLRLFSFVKVSGNVNTEKRLIDYLEFVPSVAIEAKEKIHSEDSSLQRTARQAEYNKLKIDKYARLGVLFNH